MALSPHVLRVAGVVRVRGAEGWRGNDLSLLQLGHDLLSATVQVVEGGLCSCVGILETHDQVTFCLGLKWDQCSSNIVSNGSYPVVIPDLTGVVIVLCGVSFLS